MKRGQLVGYLSGLGEESLSTLLRRRPDLAEYPHPGDLWQVAERLDSPRSLGLVLSGGALPHVQVATAIAALGGRPTRARLAQLLGRVADEDLNRVLSWLEERFVLRPGAAGADVVEAAPGLFGTFRTPLSTSAPARMLVAGASGEWAIQVLSVLGVEPEPAGWTTGTARSALLSVLSDPDRVRAIAAGADQDVQRGLGRFARQPDPFPYDLPHDLPDVDDDVDDDLEGEATQGDRVGAGGASWRRGGGGYPPMAAQPYPGAATAVTTWASARGLVIWSPAHYDYVMPAEVALALRGPAYRAPFTPRPPSLTTRPVAAPEVANAGAAAALAADAQATAVLDAARNGIAILKGGGVGTREINRLSQTTGSSPLVVRLMLELLLGAGAFSGASGRLTPGKGFDALREAEPASRMTRLLLTWLALPGHPTLERLDGRPFPACAGLVACVGCGASRGALLEALATLPDGQATRAEAIAGVADWSSAIAHAVPVPDPPAGEEMSGVPYGYPWREAELLGVLGAGALTPLGRQLVATSHDGIGTDDVAALLAAATSVLPSSVDAALLGTDCTAVVTGTPSARVAALLDGCADRESRGAGATWRFTAGSIRRALDRGTTSEQVRADLEALGGGRVPSTLQVLISDVARRHGRLRVRAATCILHSDDVPDLAQAVADTSLKDLGLVLVAPTVATGTKGVEATVAALRKAGYLPMPEDAQGRVPRPAPRARASTTLLSDDVSPPGAPVSPERELAARLLAMGTGHRQSPGRSRPRRR